MSMKPAFENQPQVKGRSNTLAVVAILIALIAIGSSTYNYINERNQLTTFETQISVLNSTISKIKVGGSSDGTPTPTILTAQQIYNQTANSVVLIRVQLSNGTVEGSGFVYDTLGRIVTNNHVIAGAPSGSITVTFLNGTVVDATVLGRDPYSDIAIIQVAAPATLIKPLKIGVSSTLVVGDPVYALGNPFALADSMTHGIISAVDRELDEGAGYLIVDVLQTDASLNPGNSGGPLLNSEGEVVGINTAGETSTSSGVNFAVPSDTLTRELPSLIATGSYTHPYLGISGTDVTRSVVSAMNLPTATYGTLVISVASGGPADKAGVKGGTNTEIVDGSPLTIGGDVIIGADGHRLKTFYNLMVYIERNKKPGETMTLNILRNNALMNIVVTLGERP